MAGPHSVPVLAALVMALLLGTGADDASHGLSITAVAIDPQTPATLYAGTTDRIGWLIRYHSNRSRSADERCQADNECSSPAPGV